MAIYERHCGTAKPDLIIITGDVIYGETDDSGEVWKQLISVMDSFQIPWGFCFGNHDNESAKGVQWQVDTAMAAEYCCFAQGNVTGNSNYNILIEQEGEPLFIYSCWTQTAVRKSIIPERDWIRIMWIMI